MMMKKMITANKACTCVIMSAIGATLGMLAAKSLIKRCCCSEQLKCKARKAFRAVEEKLLD